MGDGVHVLLAVREAELDAAAIFISSGAQDVLEAVCAPVAADREAIILPLIT